MALGLQHDVDLSGDPSKPLAHPWCKPFQLSGRRLRDLSLIYGNGEKGKKHGATWINQSQPLKILE
jgi:hypothetical protein